ncbi:ThiF family adenylyltransferase [Lacicoccus alkaliphilus]|uniref:Adenylyltransferase and sulfurtransferase n=2 Tax=Lacicoccus TaxID=3076172 RepID=A0A1M7F3X2_9BACL|nr:adenylyltransferase and sulfurtransferase [Salinicoccus alkaliphilus DSM 16010]
MMNRYSRQTLFNKIGNAGQRLIHSRTVLIVGVGALGSLSSEMLARAGVGKLILVDRDYVELSNLQRQTLFTEDDANGKIPKVIAGAERLKDIRSDIEVDTHIAHADALLLESLAKEADLILDGTDNFDTRMLINDVAFKTGTPWVYAACVEASYSSCGFVPGVTPCYRCLVPVLPTTTLTCDTVGVISPAVHMAVSEQVTTAFKIMTDQFSAPFHMRMGNVWDMDHMKFRIDGMKEDECATCGTHEYPELEINDASSMSMRLCGRDTVQYIDERLTQDIVVGALNDRNIPMHETPYFVEFRYDDYRIVSFNNGRLLIHGADQTNKARTIVNQLFG